MRNRTSTNDISDDDAGGNRDYSIAGQPMIAPRAAPGLYLVATPIGNLGDITLRALEVLAGADVVACEDTRVTRKLMDRFVISATLLPYHEHNATIARPKILERLAQGGSVALVSDAGTPLISDPGFKLVREVQAAGFSVTTLPGASSVLAALSIAGLPTDRFFFEGFLPAKETARRARISDLSEIDATLVLFESGHRIADSLRDLADRMGDREAAICRELTKLHEEIKRAPLAGLASIADQLETRGEFVLVVAPPPPNADVMSASALDELLATMLSQGSVKDAVSRAAELSGHPRREVYARALELTRGGAVRAAIEKNANEEP